MQSRYPEVSEDQYRAHFLKLDVGQSRKVVAVVMWVTLPFIYFDFALHQGSRMFWLLLAARAGVMLFSWWTLRCLRRLVTPLQLQQTLQRWIWLVLAVTLASNATSPANYFGHYYVDIWLTAMYFIVLPLPLRMLIPPMVGFVALSLSLLVLYKEAPSSSYIYNVAFMLVAAAVSGHTISARTHRYRRKTLSAEQELDRQASLDPLTGVANRREFMRVSDTELQRHARLGKSLSLLLVDLDHFKQINDLHGPQAGDIVLVEVTRRVKRATRSYDCLARYGAEEFCVLLPEAGSDDAVLIAARTRATIVAMPVSVSGKELKVSASIGVATMQGKEDSIASILERADADLHKSKVHSDLDTTNEAVAAEVTPGLNGVERRRSEAPTAF